MNDKKEDLCIYRIRNAVETLGVAVLALEEIDLKRHKDAVAYFNKTYIAKEIFPR